MPENITTIEDLRFFNKRKVEFTSDKKGKVVGILLSHGNFNFQVELCRQLQVGPRLWVAGDVMTYTIGQVSDMKLWDAKDETKATVLDKAFKPLKTKGYVAKKRAALYESKKAAHDKYQESKD